MRLPEADFWRATLREILRRWDDYAQLMGYREPPETVEEFDDEGTEDGT